MAHEELKKLYEIDAKHSDTPWEFWQARAEPLGWFSCCREPGWSEYNEYRRKPDAPVWEEFSDSFIEFCKELEDIGMRHIGKAGEYLGIPDSWKQDIKDAQKWRELVEFVSKPYSPANLALKIGSLLNPKPELIQGYTREQWQRIIDEGFLCGFADDFSKGFSIIASLAMLDTSGPRPFVRGGCDFPHRFKECRPLRTKGVRQPWFGGECPVDSSSLVVAIMASGNNRLAMAADFYWDLESHIPSRIVEFIEL